MAGVIYQSIAATAANPELDDNSEVTESVAHRLGWLGRLVVGSSGYLPDHSFASPLHAYLSAWLVSLYRSRAASTLPGALGMELDRFLSEIEALPPEEAPINLADGVAVLARCLRQLGHDALATRTGDLSSRLFDGVAADSAPDPWSTQPERGWGMSHTSFYLFRGVMLAPVFERVASFFEPSTASPT